MAENMKDLLHHQCMWHIIDEGKQQIQTEDWHPVGVSGGEVREGPTGGVLSKLCYHHWHCLLYFSKTVSVCSSSLQKKNLIKFQFASRQYVLNPNLDRGEEPFFFFWNRIIDSHIFQDSSTFDKTLLILCELHITHTSHSSPHPLISVFSLCNIPSR